MKIDERLRRLIGLREIDVEYLPNYLYAGMPQAAS
jgi:hypothetical protein